jgi:hypothetical protein
LTKRRVMSLTKCSGLPEAPMRSVERLTRSSLSQRLQTREHESRLGLASSRRKISITSSSGRHALIRSWPRIFSKNKIALLGNDGIQDCVNEKRSFRESVESAVNWDCSVVFSQQCPWEIFKRGAKTKKERWILPLPLNFAAIFNLP